MLDDRVADDTHRMTRTGRSFLDSSSSRHFTAALGFGSVPFSTSLTFSGSLGADFEFWELRDGWGATEPY